MTTKQAVIYTLLRSDLEAEGACDAGLCAFDDIAEGCGIIELRLVHFVSLEKSKPFLSWLCENGLLDLSGADLSGAFLKGANLEYAYLTGADLTGADLTNASVKGAQFAGANITGAIVDGVDFGTADMQGCIGYMVELFCFIVGDDYVVSVSESATQAHCDARHYASNGESHHEWRVIKTSVQADIAKKLLTLGTPDQEYNDGYSAYLDIGKETIIDSGESSCDCSECQTVIADDPADPTHREYARICVGLCDECLANCHASDKDWVLWMIATLALDIQVHESKQGLALQYRLDSFVGMIWDKLGEDESQTEDGIDSALETLRKVSKEWSNSTRSGMLAPVIETAKWLQGVAVIDHIDIHLSEKLTVLYIEMCESEIEEIAKVIDNETKYLECNADHSVPCEDGCEDDCDGHLAECDCACDIRLRVHNGSWQVLVGDSSFDQDHRGVWGSGSISPNEDGLIVAHQLIDSLGE